jgi:cytoskeletal protein RodZ
MTDAGRTDGSENQDSKQNVREPVGETLRKHREIRKISIETLARDLKLNISYIKALEANNRDQLPADPYVRVYLRAIAGYLGLDPEQLLCSFYEERGLKPSDYKEDRSTKLTITMKKPEPKRTSWISISIVVITLGLLIVLAGKAGWIYTASSKNGKTPVPLQEDLDTAETGGGLVDSIAAVQADLTRETQTDSGTLPAQVKDSAAVKALVKKDTMTLELSAAKDSIWFQVFSDGISWRNFIYFGKPRVFTALDSFNVHIGNCSIARVKFKGSQVKISQKGVTFLKFDTKEQETWSQSKWNSTFGNRLD